MSEELFVQPVKRYTDFIPGDGERLWWAVRRGRRWDVI